MPNQTIPIQLPEAIYQRLQQAAHATHHSIEEVVLQPIRGNLPPSLDDLSPELHGVVADLQHMSDEALWSVVKEPLPPHQWRRHQRLLRKGQEGTLSAAEHQELAELRAAVDRFVIRRSYVLALLKWHGYTIPTEQDETIDARP
jgi:hypothetical protein